MNDQKSSPKKPRMANRAPRPRSSASERARAVSHFGHSRCSSDGSGFPIRVSAVWLMRAASAMVYASRTSTSSRAAFSPVSLRKISSSPFAPPPAAERRSSSIVPSARIFPF
jgi:hypothetical protein